MGAGGGCGDSVFGGGTAAISLGKVRLCSSRLFYSFPSQPFALTAPREHSDSV